MKYVAEPANTITELAPQIQSQHISSVDVVTRCLQRVDDCESQIRAWVRVDHNAALDAARALDAELAAGQYRGPLHGIPLGIKDIIDVAGWPTAAGSAAWKNRIAGRDAFLVTRLRAAGAVLLGKTVTTQYASFDPPPTRNPWNLDRTPGGSSSGSAAAVAAGMCLAAIGSQTGGSIIRPASYCGVAGFKPTYGRVSLQGVLPLAPSMDHPGPIARSAADLAAVYAAIAGYDSKDPHSVDERPEAVDRETRSSGDLAGVRFGRLGGMFQELADASVQDVFESAVDRLRSQGAVIVEATLPPQFDDILVQHRLVMAVEAAAVHEQRIAREPDEYGPCITALIEEGLRATATEYARARQHQMLTKRTVLDAFLNCDVLLCPATTSEAPDAATTGNPAFNSPWSY
ncbi:MAG: amidase, partial [Planctomycetaceae bacterium]|nr:amidase [Planctomycetaceae bacterium]